MNNVVRSSRAPLFSHVFFCLALCTSHFSVCLSLPAVELPQPDEKLFQQTIRPHLQKHCFRCHGAKKQEASFRIDQLGPDMLKESTAEVWHELVNRVNSGEMPPKNEPRLSPAELNQLNDWVFGGLKRVTDASQNTNGRVVIRRLNRQEYNNTIRDLVGVPFDAGADFPSDPAAHGFDNVGSALSVSPLHMEKYVRAARKVMDRAIVTKGRPKREVWRIQAERRSKESRGYYYENDAKYGNTGVYTTRESKADRGRLIIWALGDTSKHFPAGKFHHLRPVEKTRYRGGTLRGMNFTYPVAGEYIIRVRAFGHYPKRTMSENYLYGPPRLNVVSEGLSVLTCDVPATKGAPKIYETRFYTESLQTNIYIRNRYDLSFGLIRNDVGRISHQSPDFPQPYLAVDWYEIEGPIYDSWPPTAHTRILVASNNRDNEGVYAREVIERFASRAYRRPATDEEVARLVSVYSKARPNKPSFEEAVKVPLIAVLCSPNFLFLSEQERPLTPQAEHPARTAKSESQATKLNDYQLASRLSYFLWSSMPDEELLALAKAGTLQDDGTIEKQINRMLQDGRSHALVENFTGQWLGLRDIGTVAPDPRLFERYGEHLEDSMAGEATSFFAEVLYNDLSVINFIDSDFAMLNERLARFYEIPGVVGDHFRKVSLKPEHHRGGLLTQASMLSLTSNGTRTSPVKRGMWVLENILGDPPPPPPPDAGDISPPQVSGPRRQTVRQRLALHRSTPACAACHHKIDPLGFALENYDGSGFYREKESSRGHIVPHPQDPPVDASAELPSGRKFSGVVELKQILLEQEDKFLDCLSEKLFVYALGRGLTYADRSTVEQLRESLKKNDYHLRGLITEIVKTEAFQTK